MQILTFLLEMLAVLGLVVGVSGIVLQEKLEPKEQKLLIIFGFLGAVVCLVIAYLILCFG